ncbi:MAG: phytanoyl-CoA dioxygenase family protein [Pseudomonadota bacterium]
MLRTRPGWQPGTLKPAYDRDGVIVIDGALDADEVASLRNETAAIASGQRGELIGLANGDQDKAMERLLAIHFPHKISDVMRSTLTHPTIVEALREVIGPDIKAMQSMLFLKSAGKPGQAWHQDEFYIPTRDRSLAGVWIALDDATEENGALWFHPGSHLDGILWQTKPHGDARFDSSEEAFGFPYPREAGVLCEAKSGDVVIFDGYVLHRSLHNTCSEGYRRALVNHVMSARSLLPWSMGLPPSPREDFRDIVMVSGEDPYAWKGQEEILVPFLRPEDPEEAMRIFGTLLSQAENST